jgi:hypothetical protein
MSLTLQQIVDMATARVPHTETDQTCVDFLNQLQNRLYRQFSLPEQIEQMLTVDDQALYTLPSYIKPNRIKNIVLMDSDGENAQEYTYSTPSASQSYYTYFVIEYESSSIIGLYPAPEETGRIILITFEDGPNTLSYADMTTVPRFFHDYHMIFVYELAAELARIRKDVTLANNWENQFQELLNEALIYLSPSDSFQMKAYW